MSLGKDLFELSIAITAMDKFTGPMKHIQQSMSQSQKEIDNLTKALGTLGKNDSEIRRLTDDLQRLRRSSDFAGMANDLKKVGMSAKEIDKVKNSYQQVIKVQQEHARQADKIQKQVETSHKIAAYGLGVTGASVGTARGMWDMLDQAGEYQTMLTNIQEKTMGVGTTTNDATKRMQSFGDHLMKVTTQVTKYNDMDLANMAQQMVSGQLTLDQTQQLLLPVARYAELQERMGKDTREGAIEKAINFSHMFRHYDTKGFDNFLNSYNKYTTAMPEKSSQLADTLKYLAPVAQTMGLKEDDIMTISALANTVGLGGSHGGTNTADTILRLIPGLVGGMPTAKKTPKAYKAMEDMGFVDQNGKSVFFDPTGKLKSVDKILDIFVNASQKVGNPQKLTADWHDMLGKQGMMPAMIFGNPETIKQMKMLRSNYNKTADMDPWVEMLNSTPQGKQDLLKSNLMTAQIRFANVLAKDLTPVLDKMNILLADVIKFNDEHPRLMKMAAGFTAIATSAGLILGPLATFAGGLMTLVGNWRLVRNAANEAAAAEATALEAGANGIPAGGGKLMKFVKGVGWAMVAVAGAEAGYQIGENVVKPALDAHQKAQMDDQKKRDKALGKIMGGSNVPPSKQTPVFTGGSIEAPKEGFLGSLWNEIKPHAAGGIFNKPHLGLLAEAGPEAYIPLSNKKRGLQVWQQAGEALGVGGDRGGIGSVVINIYTQPNHDEEAIANKVVNKLGKLSRGMNMNTGMRINLGSV